MLDSLRLALNATYMLLLTSGLSLSAHAGGTAPADVAQFIKQREACDHFRGEEAYDAERKRFLGRNLKKLCTGTDAMLRTLKQKYRAQPGVIAMLERFEESIE